MPSLRGHSHGETSLYSTFILFYSCITRLVSPVAHEGDNSDLMSRCHIVSQQSTQDDDGHHDVTRRDQDLEERWTGLGQWYVLIDSNWPGTDMRLFYQAKNKRMTITMTKTTMPTPNMLLSLSSPPCSTHSNVG